MIIIKRLALFFRKLTQPQIGILAIIIVSLIFIILQLMPLWAETISSSTHGIPRTSTKFLKNENLELLNRISTSKNILSYKQEYFNRLPLTTLRNVIKLDEDPLINLSSNGKLHQVTKSSIKHLSFNNNSLSLLSHSYLTKFIPIDSNKNVTLYNLNTTAFSNFKERQNSSLSHSIHDPLISAIKELFTMRNESVLTDNVEDEQEVCHIPEVEMWPSGVIFNESETTECVGPDPIYTLKGKIFFNQKSFDCLAIPYSMF